MKLNKNMTRRLNDAKIELFCFIVNLEVDYEELAPLLFAGKTAEVIYDYVVPISELISTCKYDKLKIYIKELAGKIQVFDLILFCRQLNTNINLSPESYTFLLHLVLLLLELMTDGTVCGVNTNTGEVFVDNDFPTFFEVLLVLILDCSGKSTLLNKNGYRKFDAKRNKSAYNFVKLKYENFQDNWERVIKESSNVDIREYSEREFEKFNRSLLLNVSQSGAVHCNSFMFNNTFERSTVLDCAYWKRENLADSETCSVFFLSFCNLVTNFFAYYNPFLSRKVLIREKGVTLVLEKPFDDVKRITLKEFHSERYDEHYLFIEYETLCGIKRRLMYSLSNPQLLTGNLLYEIDVTVTLFIFAWLGISDGIKDKILSLGDEFISKLANVSKGDNNITITEIWTNLLDCSCLQESLDSVIIEDPVSWNYSGTKAFNKKLYRSKDLSYFYEYRQVGAHVRRLAKGQHASKEKIDFAKRYCLELKDGFTLVSGYERKQRVKARRIKMRRLLINLLIIVCLSLTACGSNGELTKKISENNSNSKDSSKSAVSDSEANSNTVAADSAVSKTAVNKINTNIGSLHVLVGVPYTIEVSESEFTFTILDEYDSIPLITSIEVGKAKNGLTVKSKEEGVSAIRLEKDGFEPEELTVYAHECTKISVSEKQVIEEVTDGKIDVAIIKSTVYTDYVDLFQKKLVLSRMKSLKTLEGVDGESHWITITDAKSRIYWAFYDAMSNLKAMDFTLMYPDNDLKKSLLKQCEDNLFEMLEHLKGDGIEKHGDYYVIKPEYESEDGTVLPELRISRENV